ncbi:glucose-6-phosphate isomerase [Actinobacteria bacterium YIM 96077]|uniref:Glucose-6-phosphate isomerase n=1 Tax=Phytoactinopolyspora halophila TaxID=1981511 RepID=A0A329QQL8_9ACTN|nr:glucose-6-phosphate isomerase [Phytoactinopolyspora halophila]AYY12928.1 glucose-6-phosphate isomerase [Actinobacteria bacterium YIM 96077]RAW13642.1 glucose-6-phosphate isomerase [Phytoactinopolyspora halophila]
MTSELAVTLHGVDVSAVADQLAADKIASRIASRDATLWGPDAQAEASIRLGWIDLHETTRPLLAEIEALVADVRAEGLDRIVLAGMGGSSLAPEVITRTAGVELTVLDTTDPRAVRQAVADGIERTLVVVSSKSGTTVETDSQRRAFEAAFTAAGIDAPSRMVAVTDPGSALAEHARQAGYRQLFLADPNVGGRYSALTAFGLIPSALAGADVAALLDEAAAAAPVLASDVADNPALRLGAALAGVDVVTGGTGGADRTGRSDASERAWDKVAIADSGSGIAGFADWAEQLIAESSGKQGTGILPIPADRADPEITSPPDDVLPVHLGTADTAADSPSPAVTVSGSLGAQFLLWEYATAIAGRLLGINPFDQPDVESAKTAARGMLDAPPEPEPPAFTDDGVEVRGSAGLLGGVSTLSGAVESLLSQLGEHGYVAVMAYLDREGPDATLEWVRVPLTRRTGRPTTFGWGPRFLHSTGQYHKGGPPRGVFLQITGNIDEDLEIPGRPFTFGQLITAQAAGDAKVLADLGRPVLRLHLTDRSAGVRRLSEVLS